MLYMISRGMLSALYLFCGTFKTTTLFDHIEGIRLTKESFVQMASVFPLKPLGYTPEPDFYRKSVGIIELGLGTLLLLGGASSRRLACCGLMFLMVGAIQTLVCLGASEQVVVPGVCLLGLYYIYRCDSQKQKQE